MKVKRNELDIDGSLEAVAHAVGRERPTCLANVGPTDRQYRPCGKPMRRYRNGVTVCEDHGEMH